MDDLDYWYLDRDLTGVWKRSYSLGDLPADLNTIIEVSCLLSGLCWMHDANACVLTFYDYTKFCDCCCLVLREIGVVGSI